MNTTNGTAIPKLDSWTKSTAAELEKSGRKRTERMPHGILKKFSVLTLAGCLAFLAATFVFSRLPIAHEYREALSIAYVFGVLIGPLFGGLAIAGLISFVLLRFFEKLPMNAPILISTLLSVGALLIATPVMLLSVSRIGDGALHYFMVGTMLNVPRYLALGIAVGYLYGRLHASDAVEE
jgi:hypothetical protein